MPNYNVQWDTSTAVNQSTIIYGAIDENDAINQVRAQVAAMGHVISRPVPDPIDPGDLLASEEAFAQIPNVYTPPDVSLLAITATKIRGSRDVEISD